MKEFSAKKISKNVIDIPHRKQRNSSNSPNSCNKSVFIAFSFNRKDHKGNTAKTTEEFV